MCSVPFLSGFSLDDINVQSEETVFEAFLEWLNHDQQRRTDRLAQLLSLIKLPLIDAKVSFTKQINLIIEHFLIDSSLFR